MSDEQVTVVAVFENRGQAEGAIDELWHAGFPKNQIGIAGPGEPFHQGETATEGMEDQAADGAVTGAVAGGALGAVAGAAVLSVLPGIGPILGGGLLLGLTTGAAAGAALGTFAGPFVALGLAEETVQHLEADLHAGRTVVVVRTDEPEQAVVILNSHGPQSVEIDGQRMSSRLA